MSKGNPKSFPPRDITPIDKQELSIHLKEYEMLSNSIRTDIERIDKIIGLYAAAVFAIIAFFLKETKFDQFLSNIDHHQELVGLALLIPLINSTLLIHSISTFQVILVKARCSTYVIGERLRLLLQREVLVFDKIYDIDKQAWLAERSVVGMIYSLLSTIISVLILYRYAYVLKLCHGKLIFVMWAISCLVTSLSISFLVRHHYVNKHFATLHKQTIKLPWFLRDVLISSMMFLFLLTTLFFFGYEI